jgi:molecular chaperone DnaK (HSP70)
MVREAERNAEEDKKQREAVDMKNQVTHFPRLYFEIP